MAEVFREPQSANEALLQNILGADNEIREPQSVTEYYLKKIWENGTGGGGGSGKDGKDGVGIHVTDTIEEFEHWLTNGEYGSRKYIYYIHAGATENYTLDGNTITLKPYDLFGVTIKINADTIDEMFYLGNIQGKVVPDKTVDLIVFAGQSNMAGHGDGADAPKVSADAGLEFRPISDPTKLYEIDEATHPFGLDENHAYNASDVKIDGINDVKNGVPVKTGSLVPAFINSYYYNTGVKIIGVSASQGSTTSTAWTRANRGLYQGAINRFNDAKKFLEDNGYKIRRKLMVWLQGESDGTAGVTEETYKTNINDMFNTLIKENADIEKLLVIRIGHLKGETAEGATDREATIITATTNLCKTTNNIILISTILNDMTADSCYVRDSSEHFTQAVLNAVGTDAGTRAAQYVNTGVPPIMYDTFTDEIFIRQNSEVLNKYEVNANEE